MNRKAKLNKSDAPETKDFICFHGCFNNNAWVNAERYTLDSGLDVVGIDSFCGTDIRFGPKNLRKLANKLLGWADDMETKTALDEACGSK